MLAKRKNICILTSSLAQGGAEKVAAIQSKMLQDLGYNVFIASVLNDIVYEYTGNLLNLGALKGKNNNHFYRIQRLFILKKFIKDNQIDLLIDHRSRNSFYREFLLKFLLFNKTTTIFVIHSHNILKSFPRNKFLSVFLYSKKCFLVSVSKSIQTHLVKKYEFQNITNIYNSAEIDILETRKSTLKENYILYFGRFDEDAKDLTFLINAYKNSDLPSKHMKLFLLGNGPDKIKISNLIVNLNLTEHIIIKPYTNNPYPMVINAKFTVLTSNYEGFPMSIVESLACETPVVSVDCESGPREIIQNNINGLLVKKDLKTYTNALNLMASNTQLLAFCKTNCLKSIQHLSYKSIKKQWGFLIDNILKEHLL